MQGATSGALMAGVGGRARAGKNHERQGGKIESNTIMHAATCPLDVFEQKSMFNSPQLNINIVTMT